MAKRNRFKPGDYIVHTEHKYVMKVVQDRYLQGVYLLFPIKFPAPRDDMEAYRDINFIKQLADLGLALDVNRYKAKMRIFGHKDLGEQGWKRMDANEETLKVLYGKAQRL